MKEQFVTYEIALKLKEKGFDEPCFRGYNSAYTENNKPVLYDFVYGELQTNTMYEKRRLADVNVCTAPLWQQVIDWFRDKYEIEIIVEKGPDDIGYSYHIYYKEDGKYRVLSGFGHHEEVEIEYDHYYARKKAIEHGLKLHGLKLQSGI